MISPDFWLDEEIAELTPYARLLYIGLWGVCDDNYATFPNRPKWVKAQVFPYDSVNTHRLLTELSDKGKIILFKAEDGEEYFFIKNFFKYQKVERPSKPKYPQFEDTHRVLTESSPNTLPEVKLSKVKLSISKEKRSVEDFNRAINNGFIEKIKTDFPLHDVDLETEKMRDFLKASTKTYQDYQAFFRNWLRRAEPTRRKVIQV